MRNVHVVAVALLVAGVAVACSGGNPATFQHISVVDASHIALHARHAPDAMVTADGALSIAGTPVAITPTQRDLLRQYFTDAIALRDDGLATGAAGAGIAAQAIGSVVSGLASGTPDKIGPEIEAKAAKIDEHVTKLCTDLAALHHGQQALAAQLAAFRPYATIEAEQVSGCNSR